jgi:uncharacterized protein (TIGR00290 family)
LRGREKILFSWSGGKDSAMALHEVLADDSYDVAALLTTVTEDYERISMHGVRRSLLMQQARSLGLPLVEVLLPRQASNEEYEARVAETLQRFKDVGVTSVAFGDIFLEDLRAYREKNLARMDLKGLFPIWKRDTSALLRSFIGSGFKAVTVCVDTQSLGRESVGRVIDEQFISELPAGVDVCGENGEYHSFVYDGPILGHRVAHKTGRRVLREDRFYYCDLMPV